MAKIAGASVMLTIDESFNTEETRFSEYMRAEIKGYKTLNAGTWLDPKSTDVDVVANRDCPTDSKCFPNYVSGAVGGHRCTVCAR